MKAHLVQIAYVVIGNLLALNPNSNSYRCTNGRGVIEPCFRYVCIRVQIRMV